MAVKILFYELRKKHRENFMNKNLELKIDEKSDFIFFPMHQEMERILLIQSQKFLPKPSSYFQIFVLEDTNSC